MDISGEHQADLTHDITKTRLSKDGRELETLKNGGQSCVEHEAEGCALI
jgi:hypothetical protein